MLMPAYHPVQLHAAPFGGGGAFVAKSADTAGVAISATANASLVFVMETSFRLLTGPIGARIDGDARRVEANYQERVPRRPLSDRIVGLLERFYDLRRATITTRCARRCPSPVTVHEIKNQNYSSMT